MPTPRCCSPAQRWREHLPAHDARVYVDADWPAISRQPATAPASHRSAEVADLRAVLPDLRQCCRLPGCRLARQLPAARDRTRRLIAAPS
jgi:hypothetical protein